MFSKKEKRPRINKKIRLEEDKVVDTVDVKDIADKKVFCRCWKSKKVKQFILTKVGMWFRNLPLSVNTIDSISINYASHY